MSHPESTTQTRGDARKTSDTIRLPERLDQILRAAEEAAIGEDFPVLPDVVQEALPVAMSDPEWLARQAGLGAGWQPRRAAALHPYESLPVDDPAPEVEEAPEVRRQLAWGRG